MVSFAGQQNTCPEEDQVHEVLRASLVHENMHDKVLK
jgi:hypothetical protein